MDLQEEYIRRKKVPAHYVKYPTRANLILRAKKEAQPDWLHVSIDSRTDNTHPAFYQFVISANPVIYASADFSHFSYHNMKILQETRWEWEQYENGIMNWAAAQAKQYYAIPSSEAIFVSWEMFLTNYDSWFANFMPIRVVDWLVHSLVGDKEQRLKNIAAVQNWLQEKHEKIHACWRNIRDNLDRANYADWLAEIVNDLGK